MKKAEEEAMNILKTRSADEEDKDWSFPHMDKINSELNSANASVGSVLASMVFELS